MQDIMARYDKLDGEVKKRRHGVSQPGVVATLVLASVVQETGEKIADSLSQLPLELKYELARLLAERIPVRP